MIPHWQNYLDHRLEERESMYGSYKKPQQTEPIVISHNEGKIHSVIMHERLDLCSQEKSLPRRIMMLERLRGQVERASIPYIDFLIKKTKSKLEN